MSKDRPQNKHLQPGTHLDALGVTPLEEGQISVTARLRAKASAARWWESLTTEERGKFVERLHDQNT